LSPQRVDAMSKIKNLQRQRRRAERLAKNRDDTLTVLKDFSHSQPIATARSRLSGEAERPLETACDPPREEC